MTLITNVIRDQFILMAGDRRIIDGNGVRFPDAKKLFVGSNYCIGIEGTMESKNFIASDKVKQYIIDFNSVSPEQINLPDLHNRFVPKNNDPSYLGLRLTISGSYEDRLFSFYYCACCNQFTNLIVSDKENIRFNQFNHKDYGLFRSAMYGGPENLSELVNPSDLFVSLQKVYNRISSQINDIGELEDCCVIFKDRVEWLRT